jgi:hypothetical protein
MALLAVQVGREVVALPLLMDKMVLVQAVAAVKIQVTLLVLAAMVFQAAAGVVRVVQLRAEAEMDL